MMLATALDFCSRNQLATGFFLGKLKAGFDEELVAVYKAGIQNGSRPFLQSQVVDYQARVAELADALDSGSSE